MTPARATLPTRDLVLTRTFHVSPDRLWEAWTIGDRVMQWWGPAGFVSPSARMDVRVGRSSLVCMRAPAEFGGQDLYNTWTYQVVEPMRSLEFTLDWADRDGNRVAPVAMGLPPDTPRDVRHLVTIEPAGDGRAKLTVTEFGYTSDQQFELSKAGLQQCLDKMAASFGTG
ncbi:MAG: SRPBCC domain-containing protein [Chloroflexota bacterium]